MNGRPPHILCVGFDQETESQIIGAFEDRESQIEFVSLSYPSEAIEHLESISEAVTCVISSNTVGDMSGVAFLRHVRESFPHLPYVLFVEDLSRDLINEAIDANVTDYIPQEGDLQVSRLVDRVIDVVTQYRTAHRAAELERINNVIRELNRELIRTSTPEEIDRRVCEILSESDQYVFAWIGEHDPESQTVIGRAAAGVEEGYLDAITISTDETPTAKGPTGKSVRTKEIHVVQDIQTDPTYEPWREEALKRGYRSRAAIPLVYDGTLYGVLNLYADRTNTFDAEERALLSELGDTIAFAHHELHLHEETRRFHRAVEQAAEAIFITDADGTIEYLNPAFEQLTGYDASEAIGRNPRILKSGEQPEAYYESMWATILDGEIWEAEIINKDRSGEQYHAEQTIAPLLDESGDLEGFVAIQRDITERKEQERELRQLKDEYETVFNTAQEGIFLFDVEETDGEYEFTLQNLNPTHEAVSGMSAEEDRGKTPKEFLGDDEGQRVVENYHRCVESKAPISYEEELEMPGGTIYWQTSLAPVMEDGEVTQIVGIARDISERKVRERELEESKNRLRLLFDQAPDGMIVHDIEGDVLDVNEAIGDNLGYPRDELLEMEVFDFEVGLDEDTVRSKWHTMEPGSLHRVEIEGEHLRKDGSTYPCEIWISRVTGEFQKRDHFIALIRDISDRKERERERRETQRRLELSIETADAGVWEWDVESEIVHWEESMETLVGLEPTTFEGTYEAFIDRVHPDDRQSAERTIEYALEEGSGFEKEFRVRHESGDYIWFLTRAQLITDATGDPLRMIGVGIDISERIDLIRQLEVLDRVLRHNLRNDMTKIRGYAEIIRANTKGVTEETGVIIDTSTQILNTVEKQKEIVALLIERPEQVTLDIGAICQQVLDGISENYPERKITIDIPDEASVIAVRRIERAIRELIENALIHSDRDSPEISMAIELAEETCKITIADNGPGIPADEVNVLTREYEIEPLYHGSGLGLWLVNWIVKLSDGTIVFEENDPQGSIVTIELDRPTASSTTQ